VKAERLPVGWLAHMALEKGKSASFEPYRALDPKEIPTKQPTSVVQKARLDGFVRLLFTELEADVGLKKDKRGIRFAREESDSSSRDSRSPSPKRRRGRSRSRRRERSASHRRSPRRARRSRSRSHARGGAVRLPSPLAKARRRPGRGSPSPRRPPPPPRARSPSDSRPRRTKPRGPPVTKPPPPPRPAATSSDRGTSGGRAQPPADPVLSVERDEDLERFRAQAASAHRNFMQVRMAEIARSEQGMADPGFRGPIHFH